MSSSSPPPAPPPSPPQAPGVHSPHPSSQTVMTPSNTQVAMSPPNTSHGSHRDTPTNEGLLPTPVTARSAANLSVLQRFLVFVTSNTTVLVITFIVTVVGILVASILASSGNSTAQKGLALAEWTAKKDFRAECEKNKGGPNFTHECQKELKTSLGPPPVSINPRHLRQLLFIEHEHHKAAFVRYMQLFAWGIKKLHYFVMWSARWLIVFLISLRLSGLLACAIFYPGPCQAMYRMCVGALIANLLADWYQLQVPKKSMGFEAMVVEVAAWFFWICTAGLVLVRGIGTWF
ncbi:hypothetical protein K440DRAFT_664669 [Wilcoxina mikolae CBS 423.85]|nr:hypothetical protein K440DRAFT_664669 [Wilcoxina mikolae CBS 423.85]